MPKTKTLTISVFSHAILHQSPVYKNITPHSIEGKYAVNEKATGFWEIWNLETHSRTLAAIPTLDEAIAYREQLLSGFNHRELQFQIDSQYACLGGLTVTETKIDGWCVVNSRDVRVRKGLSTRERAIVGRRNCLDLFSELKDNEREAQGAN